MVSHHLPVGIGQREFLRRAELCQGLCVIAKFVERLSPMQM
jgi:hypothetical protein